MTKEEREREIARISKLMPLQPPEGSLPIIEERGKIGGEVVVYKSDSYYDWLTELRKPAVNCRCSSCRDGWFAPKLTGGCTRMGASTIGFLNGTEQLGHGDSFLCPNCGAEVKAIHVARFGSSLRYRISDCTFLTVANVGGHLAVLEWYAERSTDKAAVIQTEIRRYEATVVIGGKCVRFVGHQRSIGGREAWFRNWEPRKQYFDNSESCKGEDLLPFAPELLFGTDAEKSGFEDYCRGCGAEDPLFPAMFLQLWCERPEVENLVRTGNARFVSGMMAACIVHSYALSRFQPKETAKYADWKKKKPNEIMHLTKDEYRKLRGERFELINYYQELKDEYGLNLTPKLIAKVRAVGTKHLRPLTAKKAHYDAKISPVRIINYVYKRRTDASFAAKDLLDHWRILHDYYGRLPEELIFPRDFAAAHQKFTELLTAKKCAGQDAGIRANAARMEAYEWRDEASGLLIRPAESTWELIQEGKTLHHCVGTYAKEVARGDTTIFFIRRIDRPDEPFFTLELKNGVVMQNRGDHNCPRTPEVQAFENAWLDHIREVTKKKERKTA